MKKGIRGHDLDTVGIRQVAERCRKFDIDYLQLVLEKSMPDFEYGKFSEEFAFSIKNDLGDTKIAVLGSYINPSAPDAEQLENFLNRFKEKIKYASILKPMVVGTETGKYIEGKTHTEEAYQYLLKNIKELVGEAEKFDVTIGIEGVHLFVINSPEMMARLINDVNSDNLKVIFDPCNLINIENYTRQDEIINSMFDLLSDKIAVFHAKDFIVEDGKITRVVPGEGLLNYELIFNRMSPDIPVIVEEIDEQQALKAFENLKKYECCYES